MASIVLFAKAASKPARHSVVPAAKTFVGQAEASRVSLQGLIQSWNHQHQAERLARADFGGARGMKLGAVAQ
jgi:hypothetical protein